MMMTRREMPTCDERSTKFKATIHEGGEKVLGKRFFVATVLVVPRCEQQHGKADPRQLWTVEGRVG